MKYYAPSLTDRDFNKPVGKYSQSMFQTGIARALTATSLGNLVVWDNNRPLSKSKYWKSVYTKHLYLREVMVHNLMLSLCSE